MTERFVVLGEDLPRWAVAVAIALCLVYAALSIRDVTRKLRTRKVFDWLVPGGGVAAAALTCLAVLRPCTVKQVVSPLSGRVVVLMDRARRMSLKADGRSRTESANLALGRLRQHFKGLSLQDFEFGAESMRMGAATTNGATSPMSEDSDLNFALERLAESSDVKPSAIVVVSDGRWLRPSAATAKDGFELPPGLKGTTLHAVDVGGRLLRDASVLSVGTVGSAVAHQSLVLDVTVYCAKSLHCGKIPVVVRAHKRGVEPEVLARGDVEFGDDTTSRISLDVTLERAGTRIVEVAIEAPSGDEVPENDRRFVTIDVVRDRLRLLHVAGRPTYDVRALRTWLKSDSSVDLVSFFILRTDSDDTNADEETELSLIPFPVDELFNEHLPSFDAVILEDIDAERYRLARHFENLARYVEQGGGLLLVGGPSAFSGGAYVGSPIERVLPTALVSSEHPFDTVEFVPRVTAAGKTTRILEPLRAVLGNRLPSMPGANSLGPLKPKAVGLWEHPIRTALPLKTGGAPGAMPILAVTEARDGRVVALAVDGTHRLAWGQEGLETAGRAYGALWDGLLGWVMRDRRYESAQGSVMGDCIVGQKTLLRVDFAAQVSGEVLVEVQKLDRSNEKAQMLRQVVAGARTVEFTVEGLAEGAYSALARAGDEPEARFDFACERGGRAWADSRADHARLRDVVARASGLVVADDEIERLPRPENSHVASYRQATAWLPAWTWALGASLALALHWISRRRAGLV